MDQASDVIFALKPVSFRYKEEIDRSRALSFGLIAEEVAEISPELITRDTDGRPQTVRYEAVNAMLLNEFLKEHRTVQEQGATIAELKKEIADLVATVKEQAAQIQKVNARLEVSNSAQLTANELKGAGLVYSRLLLATLSSDWLVRAAQNAKRVRHQAN